MTKNGIADCNANIDGVGPIKDMMGTNGKTAGKVCCICGGGSRPALTVAAGAAGSHWSRFVLAVTPATTSSPSAGGRRQLLSRRQRELLDIPDELKGVLDTFSGDVLGPVNEIGKQLDKVKGLVNSGLDRAAGTWRKFAQVVVDRTIEPVSKSIGELANVGNFIKGVTDTIADIDVRDAEAALGAMGDAVTNTVGSIKATFEGLVTKLFEGLLPTAADFLKTMRNKILESIGLSEGLCVDIPQCLDVEEIVLYDVPEFGTAKLGNFVGPKFCIAGKCRG